MPANVITSTAVQTPPIPEILQYLIQACERFGYTWRVIDTHSQNLLEISNGKKSFVSTNRYATYPLNQHNSATLVHDKAWSGMYLAELGYKTPRGDFFFLHEKHRERRADGRERSDAFRFAKELGYPIFVKPHDSSLGRFAETIHNDEMLAAHLDTIAEVSKIAMIQENIEFPEYRVFVLDGEVEFCYRKTKPWLEEGKMHREYSEYSEQPPEALVVWARTLVERLNLRICGIDLFAPQTLANPDDFIVIELNDNPALRGLLQFDKGEKAMEVWGKILRKYFEE
ncbi:hypothetical protein COV82_03880 [Candidatus Peregrinibacteria bacterium CG11_big_fil_rev_8_21_14_0_20_46_8]|nr:MAG: hypothetical protein COV82_03880 [Candidatus Peregrinibacteria bacterium CG11_big_fil_rev_8_21_14_0_20_46_8]